MAEILESITQFDGGMVNDLRTPDPTAARLIKNFDTLTYQRRLVPYPDSESGNNDTTRNIVNFFYANSILYGLGAMSGTTKPQVFSKTDFTDASWITLANSQGSTARGSNLFVYYKGNIYGAQANASIWKMDAGGGGWTDQDLNIGFTYKNVAQGLVHSKDDILYVPVDNVIFAKNDASWSNSGSPVLTLPTDYYITSICEYGNYLAIACAPTAAAARPHSQVYLWDRDSSLTTLSESIDWGDGQLLVLQDIEGVLLGITALTTNNLQPRLIVKQYAGTQGAVPVVELVGDIGTTINLQQAKQKAKNRIYFLANIVLDGVTHYGVWSVGKNNGRPFSLQIEQLINNNTAPNSVQGFFVLGDFLFVAYTDGSGNPQVSKTDDLLPYTATSIYESRIFNEVLGLRNKHIPDSAAKKKLLGITASFSSLPSGAHVLVKYKKDGETSWTAIFDFSTTGALSHAAVNIESTGANLPEYKEIQFRIESTGGAVVTGSKFKAEIEDKDLY